MCHKSMAHPHIYFSLRLNIFSLKAKFIFFQACKSGGTSSGKYNSVYIISATS